MNIEQTADGSRTLYVPELDEHYHSVKGALTESQHIFIDMGLKHCPLSAPRILEIGLGTGLNCFLTLLTAEEEKRHIHYTGIERFPLNMEVIRQLDYPSLIGRGHEEDYFHIHEAPWEEDAVLSPWFTLHKIEGDFTSYTLMVLAIGNHNDGLSYLLVVAEAPASKVNGLAHICTLALD